MVEMKLLGCGTVFEICDQSKQPAPSQFPAVRVETKPVPVKDYPLCDMPRCSRGILTQTPYFVSSIVGDLVMRIRDEFVVPRAIGGNFLSHVEGYRYRPLNENDAIEMDNNSVNVTQGTPQESGEPIQHMAFGAWGILTHGHRKGQPIFRGADGSFHYNCGDGWDASHNSSDYRFRPLQPGEKIIIEG